jgi:serine protease Do
MRWYAYVLLSASALVLAGGAAPAATVPAPGQGHGDLPVAARTAAPAEPKAPSLDAATIARAVETAIRDAAEHAGPAVVNISVVREVDNPLGLDESDIPPDIPEGLRERFRDYFERHREGQPFRSQGNGSGCIISPDGFILTSEHVVRKAVQIEVTLATRKRYEARVVGADPRRDLAVIRIQAKGLPVARFGDATRLRRGQFVLALGSPFGFGRDGQASVSFGVVSGTGRAIPGIGRELDRYYGDLIQTDAAVNPGNSGGPLVDLDGEVVGVNAVISSRDGSSDGVGFAVPINLRTRTIIERLMKGEEVAYGFLGVEMQEVGEEEAKRTGAETGVGAFVVRVLEGTPAEKAGLKHGDVILSVDAEAVRDPDDLVQAVQATPVGDKIRLGILRAGRKQTLLVETIRRPPPDELMASRASGAWWRGMRVEPLSKELREGTNLKPDQPGVFVREVRDASPAAEAGLAPGMVLDQVGDQKIASVREFLAATRDKKGPCFVHVVGQGVRVVAAPGEPAPPKPPDAPKPPEPPAPKP